MQKKPTPEFAAKELGDNLRRVLQDYLDAHQGREPRGVWLTVMSVVKPVFLEVMMRYVHGNQSKAAEYSGINRGTWRTYLQNSNML